MIKAIEQFFVYLLAIWMSSFVKSLLKPFAQYLLGYMAIYMDIHVAVFPFDYSSSLYFRVKISISFSKSIYSPIGALWGLNILILMSSFIILFNMCLCFFVLFNKSLPTQDHNNIQWSSQDLYDFSFIIRSAVHLELMFEWLRINIIGFHSARQTSIIYSASPFPLWIALSPLSWIRWPTLFLDSLVYSTDPFVYLYTNTIL